MKLLFTGASGFLGNNVRPLLEEAYDVVTMGLLPQDDYVVNIAKEIPKLRERYDIVLHAAGKAHFVPKTEVERQVFFDVNLQGTKNLCTALEQGGIPRVFIFISTVAVYGCDFGENITEEHPLNGVTPYAMSKRLAEEYLQKWCYKHHVILGIIRPSLIAGSQARKSVLMVQDIAKLVPLLVEKGGIYNVCDSHQPTFRELETIICKQLNKNLPLSIPYWVAKSMALIGDCLGKKAPINSLKLMKITRSLTFSNEKVIRELGWKSTNVLENFRIE